MGDRRAAGKEKSTGIRFRGVGSPNRNRTKSAQCGRSTCTSPKEPRPELRSHNRPEQPVKERNRSRRRSTFHGRCNRTKTASAVPTFPSSANGAENECCTKRTRPGLNNYEESTAIVVETRPSKPSHK